MRRPALPDALDQRLVVLRASLAAVEVLARTDRKSAEAALRLALRAAQNAPR
ncbi:MAG: hypothetical protein WCK73_14500 [Deltaproteobacteria bacterium]